MAVSPLPDLATVWHTLSADRVLSLLQSDRQSGLTSSEASHRQHHYGHNELEDVGGRSNWEILLDQFSNIMLILLIGVAVISGLIDLLSILDILQANAANEIPFKDTIAIALIVILNGILGYAQESRAEKALAALKKLASPKVRIIRDGKLSEIASKDLVPGDIVQLEAGGQVPADGRILEEVNLQIREAALTGEAQTVRKQVDVSLSEDTPLGDRVNLLFQGTDIAQGRGTMIVTRTGMKTELGRIATLIQSVESEPTPLQIRMDQLSHALVRGSLSLVLLVVVGGLIAAGWGRLQELVEVSLSMAVAVVPEGLPAVITVALALGTQRMVRRKALIRKLPAVETLGSVTTICSDKTGTLTQNKMIVQAVYTANFTLQVTGEGYIPEGGFYGDTEITPSEQPELRPLLVAGAICNDAVLQRDNNDWIILGDPTEGALLPLAEKAGLPKKVWNALLPRVGEFPFSSERKRMSVICQPSPSEYHSDQVLDSDSWLNHGKPYILFTKGSPELILGRCSHIQMGDQAEVLQDHQREQILTNNNQIAANGLRVLGFACRSLASIPSPNSDDVVEQDLVWLGLIGMLDAPRLEVKEAVMRCLSAGIRPVMITGDHQLTAQAIAQSVGIAQPGGKVLTGKELEKLSPTELEARVETVDVYARVAPEHKLRIVQALQRKNHIVAMTGDGVNDAPALKQADIGIAMGITGTDVSKEASDMVLLDDNFATIVSAVEEGRVVYSNIRRFIRYILGSNIGELLTIGAAPFLGIGSVPLSPLQILWMNLVTDGLPALALAVEPANPNVMKRSPYNPSESVFSRGLGTYMVRIGIVFAIISISFMVWAYGYSQTLDPSRQNLWKTMVFTMLCIAQMGHAISIRSSSRLIVEMNPLSNPYVPISVVFTIILQLLLVYVPVFQNFFRTEAMTLRELGTCVAVSSLLMVWVELEKIAIRIYKSLHKDTNHA